MKLKIPELKRCCFCIPLRHGLVAWGYFKMTADAFLMTALSIFLTQSVIMAKVLGPDDDILSMISVEVIIPVIAFAVLIVDFEVTLMFVIGGFEKNVMLTQVFYFISIAMWIFSLLVTATFVVIEMQKVADNLVGFSFYFLNLVVQTYFLILLRSEIIKLKNIAESGSQNNAAEAESTRKCEEIAAGEEAVNDVV